ncbi:growth arrest and DNA damage-inducible protein GADD45 alpha-like [Amphiura filiformis]|uniref:growth arrest and DNA damage-inducible protein GADD45 alpha-like n=1 Tax=Amphiura filiformis TaxID=82378 RepID=UPI003B214FDB
MTLEEENSVSQVGNRVDNKPQMEMGEVLREVLLRAKDDGRITCGVYRSAHKLDMDPDHVMLCIHADSSQEDVALHIHFTLMEAFCTENYIRLFKVDGHEQLAKLLGDMKHKSNMATADDNSPVEEAPRISTEDCVCLLVEYPKEMDATTTALLEFYQSHIQMGPFPHIKLAE